MKAKAGWIVATAVVLASFSAAAASAGKLITGKQIKDRSIATRDLAVSARPAAGVRGPAGPAGGLSDVRSVETPPVGYGPLTSETAVIGLQATCPAGTTLVGGGYRHHAEGSTSIVHSVIHNAPAGPNAWGVILVNLDDVGDELIVVAQCATGSPAATKLPQRSSTAGSSDFDRAIADAKRHRAARSG